jgi:hypothetical protein
MINNIDKGAAETASALMKKPALSWQEFWQGVMGLPVSTAEQVAREGNFPKFFMVGRRRFIKTEDAVAWISDRAASAPYFKRKNRTKEKVADHD